MNETLRVCGSAEIVTHGEALESLSESGKAPPSGLKVTVKDAFLRCGRALIRSRLWDSEARIDRSACPTYGQVLADQIKGAEAQAIDAEEDEANRNKLY